MVRSISMRPAPSRGSLNAFAQKIGDYISFWAAGLNGIWKSSIFELSPDLGLKCFVVWICVHDSRTETQFDLDPKESTLH